MTNSLSSTGSAKKRSRSPSQENTPRNVRFKRSDSETSLLGMEDSIDTYRETLKAEGCIEIDIPETLQKEIDAVNEILKANQHNHRIYEEFDDQTPDTIEYMIQHKKDISQKDKKIIENMCNNFSSFIHKLLSKIFNDHDLIETSKLDLLIRNNNYKNYFFHKDPRIFEKDHKFNFTDPTLNF